MERVPLFNARGDFHEDLDVDVALLVNANREELEHYFDAIAEIMSEALGD